MTITQKHRTEQHRQDNLTNKLIGWAKCPTYIL